MLLRVPFALILLGMLALAAFACCVAWLITVTWQIGEDPYS